MDRLKSMLVTFLTKTRLRYIVKFCQNFHISRTAIRGDNKSREELVIFTLEPKLKADNNADFLFSTLAPVLFVINLLKYLSYCSRIILRLRNIFMYET